MYKSHFGLREIPFSITPDTSYFFLFASFQAALNTLLVAAKSGEGFIKITGEVGTGKTMLCRKFMTTLGPDFVTAYIPNPLLDPSSLMRAVADELEVPANQDTHQLLKSINHRLLDLARQGKRVLLCIDEAQALPLDTLEALRLLSNLETEKRKLLQIVLFGQPELDVKLARNEIRQLAQRITFHYHLRPLNKQEIQVYIAHRLAVAGCQQQNLFSRAALSMLYLSSGGIPRLLNILAHKALMLSFGAGKPQVGIRQVLLAANDTLGSTSLSSVRNWFSRLSLGLAALAFISVWIYLK
ncbi:AAA family ATPase [Undibacterium sp. Jales W-56]|uniref:ExeA family protein n=1 Tax=Undibacterium sp. Jales W-56 TaxID=2897325 RepID=UPI0021D220ED|nr:AAA family ATPase [Undibacterium sp. Jales W-56]MCU6432704.1 AAA family ATPase [Undibacterium sp. Jales W-56]